MTARILAWCSPLLLLLAGCLEDPHPLVVTGTPPPPSNRPDRHVSRAPATEASARRVIAVGARLVAANPAPGIRPVFVTVGAPQMELFHTGGGLDSYQVYISEGLVQRCVTDEQLAAVLSTELGRIVSERETISSGRPRRGTFIPPSEQIGSEVGGSFGSADGTRLMELGHLKRQQDRVKMPPASPDALAGRYLGKAGIDPSVLADVAPLLRQAEEQGRMERQFKTPVPAAPLTAAPARVNPPTGVVPALATESARPPAPATSAAPVNAAPAANSPPRPLPPIGVNP